MSVTQAQLQAIMPRMVHNPNDCAKYLPLLNAAMLEVQINSRLRTCSFLAQVAHESGEFKYMEEIWGPTDAQKRYEPVTTLSARLGNTQPGDGFRFKGRGPIQLTGRSNYKACGIALKLDLINHPELAALPEHAFRVACWFWSKNSINTIADTLKGDIKLDCCANTASLPVGALAFDKITKTINGGFNGAAERDAYYKTALHVITT